MEGEVVDLIPVIKENLLLEIPMQVFVRMSIRTKALLNPGKTGPLFLKRKMSIRLIRDLQSLPTFLTTIKNLDWNEKSLIRFFQLFIFLRRWE